MSDANLIGIEQGEFRRTFNIKVDLSDETDEEIEALIKFLRSSNENESVRFCNYWLGKIATIIENKD